MWLSAYTDRHQLPIQSHSAASIALRINIQKLFGKGYSSIDFSLFDLFTFGPAIHNAIRAVEFKWDKQQRETPIDRPFLGGTSNRLPTSVAEAAKSRRGHRQTGKVGSFLFYSLQLWKSSIRNFSIKTRKISPRVSLKNFCAFLNFRSIASFFACQLVNQYYWVSFVFESIASLNSITFFPR